MADHLSDEEQLEAIKKWWKANGSSLLLAIVLVAGGWFGWTYWQERQQQKAEEASLVYMAMLDAVGQWEQGSTTENAEIVAAHAETLKKLAADSRYGQYAALTIARLAVADNELDVAVSELEWVLSNSDDEVLNGLVTFRLALLEYNRQKPERALSLLNGSHLEAYNALYEELKGDIFTSKGDNESASVAYHLALENLDENDTRTRAMIELKINELAPVAENTAGVETEDA